jgi:hypothetical protein
MAAWQGLELLTIARDHQKLTVTRFHAFLVLVQQQACAGKLKP